jgi:ATP-dependent protease HslVU (ClpYQ) peptidase subunit
LTCIVGLEHEGCAWIGGDAIAVDDSQDSMILTSPKVFALMDGQLVVGHSGGLRELQALKYGLADLTAPLPDVGREEQWLCGAFADSVRDAFRRFGILKNENGVEKTGCFLIGLRGGVYLFEESCGVLRSVKGYAALGCGAKYALGAISALSRYSPNTPARMIEIALYAASQHNAWVKGPFTILSTPKAQEGQE